MSFSYDRAREFLEKLLDNQLRRDVEQSLADAGDHAAYLHLTFILHFGGRVHEHEREQPFAFQEPDFARSFHDQAEAVRWTLIGQTHLAIEQTLDARYDHFHLHFVLVLAYPRQMVAAGHAFGK